MIRRQSQKPPILKKRKIDLPANYTKEDEFTNISSSGRKGDGRKGVSRGEGGKSVFIEFIERKTQVSLRS